MFSFIFILICVVFAFVYLYHFVIDTLEIFNEVSDDGKLDSVYLYAAENKHKVSKEYLRSQFGGVKDLFVDIIKYFKRWVEKETY